MNNFYCKKCGKEQFISRYKSAVGEDFYRDRYGKKLVCDCGEDLSLHENKTVPNFMIFESKTPEQKKNIMLDRSHKHYKKEIEEIKRSKHKDANLSE